MAKGDLKDDEYLQCFLPQNYKGMIMLFTFPLVTRNLVEGIVLGIIFGAIVLMTCLYYMYEFNPIMISYTVIGVGVGMFLGIKGYNGESITQFVGHFIKYMLRRRVVYYNPRVKLEAKPMFTQEEGADQYVLPREKIIATFNKFMEITKTKFNSGNENFTMKTDEFDESRFIFEDDDGIEETKDGKNLSDKERKKIEKLRRKRQKELKKMMRKGDVGRAKKGRKKPAGYRKKA